MGHIQYVLAGCKAGCFWFGGTRRPQKWGRGRDWGPVKFSYVSVMKNNDVHHSNEENEIFVSDSTAIPGTL